MSPRKLAFFAIIGAIIVGIGIFMSVLSNNKKANTSTASAKNLSVWVVGDDAAGFADIIKGFKERNAAYKETDIKVTKFASYSDYERTLLNVIADGNSPDIFMVPSDAGSGILDSKTELLPGSAISSDEFSKNFNRIFDDLIVEQDGKDAEGKAIRETFLKGIPMGYESPAVYYNFDIISNAVPSTWSELIASFSSSSSSADSSSDTSSVATTSDDVVIAGLGLGSRYVPNVSDILPLFFVQNGIESFASLSETAGPKALSSYLAFGPVTTDSSSTTPVVANGNALSKAKEEMDRLNLTTIDLFVRGKIGFIIGYPSLLREIQYSVKRASGASVLNKRNLKSTNVPVPDTEHNFNIARYNYFALSKTAKESDTGLAFLTYLSTKTAQESYLTNFRYSLPAMNDLVDTRGKQVFENDFPRIKYESFLPVAGMKLKTFQKGLVPEFSLYFDKALEFRKDPKEILSGATKYLQCNLNHLVAWASFDESCEITPGG